MIKGYEGFILGVGAQKSGSSWISDVLSQHPEVMFSPVKELHYWDTKYGKFDLAPHIEKVRHISAPGHAEGLEERQAMTSPEDYARFFERRKQEGQRFAAENTPAYAILPTEALEEIRSWLPNPRLIFGMRDPTERLWSAWHMSNRWGEGHEFERFIRFPDNVERSRYDQTIERLFEVFGRENVFLYFFEDAFADNDAVHGFGDDLGNFLGLGTPLRDYAQLEVRDSINAGNPMPAASRAMVQEQLDVVLDGIERLAGRVPASWRS